MVPSTVYSRDGEGYSKSLYPRDLSGRGPVDNGAPRVLVAPTKILGLTWTKAVRCVVSVSDSSVLAR
jgi:hypothetical protein